MKSWLDIMCADRNGANFVEQVTSVDAGREEWWSAMVQWDEDGIFLVTQYNPPMRCTHEPCDHFPRNHLDDAMFDHEGNLVLDGKDVI